MQFLYPTKVGPQRSRGVKSTAPLAWHIEHTPTDFVRKVSFTPGSENGRMKCSAAVRRNISLVHSRNLGIVFLTDSVGASCLMRHSAPRLLFCFSGEQYVLQPSLKRCLLDALVDMRTCHPSVCNYSIVHGVPWHLATALKGHLQGDKSTRGHRLC